MEKNNLTVPVAIIVAGLLVAGSIFITRGGLKAPEKNNAAAVENAFFKPVSDDDHILGNKQAEIFLVEYSDTECPFCKQFHETAHQIMNEYGKDGKVAWVYRHFPLYKGTPPLHSKAGKEAEATECAAELGGNDAFWKYLDEVYTITPSNNNLDAAELPEIAEKIGLDKAKFESCLNSGKYAQKISDAYDAAVTAGATATPFSYIVTKDGTKIPVEGAQPYTKIKPVIETLLKSKTN